MSIKLKDTIYDLINRASKDSSGNIITSTYLNKTKSETVTGDITLSNSSGTRNLFINGNTTSLRLFAWDTATFIESGNADFSSNVPLKVTGISGNTGSDLYLNFSNIYCRGSNYVNIDSGNYSSYAATKDHTHSGYASSSHTHSNYVDLSTVQTISGKKIFSNGLAITGGATENTSLPFFIGIENYADGGTVKYISRDKVLSCIGAASSGHTHSYLPLSGGSLSGTLQINTSIQNHSSPTTQCLVINSTAVPSGTTLTIKNSPGIGFHVANSSWASLVLMNGKFHFINNSADGYVNIISNGFEKSGSSNSYVLLGGGGHKAVSDFATSGHTHSYIKYETGSKSIINGQQSPCLYNIENENLVTNYYLYWYVLNMGSYSGGGFRSQLAMPYQDSLTDSELFIRTANGNTWRDWRRVLTSSNYTSYAATKDHTHSQYLTSLPSHTHSYLPLSGGTMTGNITVFTGDNGRGLKFGTSTLNCLQNQLLWQSPEAIRFGSASWDWNAWAGLKYNHSSKIIYLGLADGTIFNANSAQSGGKLYTPGISDIYIGNGSYLVLHGGNASNYYVNLSGTQTISGKKTFSGGAAITNAPENTSMPYFLGIDAFADGGTIKYISKGSICSCIGAAPSSHTHSYIPLSGGTLSSGTARISRAGSSVMWYQGRSNAMMYISSYSGYNAIASMKTTNGDWSLGVYTNNYMYFTYITDTNYNSGTNTTTCQFIFRPDGYIQGNLSGYATLAGNADTVDSHHFSTVSALPSSPNSSTVYFIV